MPRKPNPSASNLADCPEPVMAEQIIHAHKKKKDLKKSMVPVRRSARLRSVVKPSLPHVRDMVEEPISLSESENEEEQEYACPDKTEKSIAPDNLEEGVNHISNETVLEEDVNNIDNETVLGEDVNLANTETVLEDDVNNIDTETVLGEDVNLANTETVFEDDVNNIDTETVLGEDVNHMDHETALEEDVDHETVNEQFKSKATKRSYPDENPNADMSYKSLYIDSLKKVEALKGENAALAKRLDFSLGKIEAYEGLKDTVMQLKDIVIVSCIGKATEAAINMASQGALGRTPLPVTPNGAAEQSDAHAKKK